MAINFMARGTTAPPLRAGHRRRLLLTVPAPAVAAQYALTEGLPAAGIAVVAVALARAARRHGEALAARFALAAGLTAAIISAVQFGLGLTLATTAAPGPAHLLFTSIDRLDGAKMLALAVLGATAATMAMLPRWLRWTGIA